MNIPVKDQRFINPILKVVNHLISSKKTETTKSLGWGLDILISKSLDKDTSAFTISLAFSPTKFYEWAVSTLGGDTSIPENLIIQQLGIDLIFFDGPHTGWGIRVDGTNPEALESGKLMIFKYNSESKSLRIAMKNSFYHNLETEDGKLKEAIVLAIFLVKNNEVRRIG